MAPREVRLGAADGVPDEAAQSQVGRGGPGGEAAKQNHRARRVRCPSGEFTAFGGTGTGGTERVS